MIPQEDGARVLLTIADLKLLCGVVRMAAAFSELCSFVPKAQNSKLSAITVKKGSNVPRESIFPEKAELFHPMFTLLDGFEGASKIPT